LDSSEGCVASSTLNESYLPTFVTGAGASLPVFTDSHMTYNPGTDTLTVGTLVGTVSGSISNAVTSSNVVVTAPSLNQDHYPTFVSASTGLSLPEQADPDLKYNPSTNTLTATNVTVTGALTATVATATTATNADKIKVTTGSGATPLSLALVDGITSNVNTLASSALTYTPSTDTLSVGTLTTASNCTIGNSLSTFTVNSGTSNIGNGGLGATDKVNIAGGTNISGSELFLGSTTLTRAFLRGVDVNINHQRAGNINIGADTLISTTNILGTTNIGSTSKVLTINAPIVVGYATSALTLNTQIGRTVRTILATQTGIANGGKLLTSVIVGTAGVYAFTYGFRYSGASTSVSVCQSWFQFSAGDDTQYGSQAIFYNPSALMDTSILFQSGTSIITLTNTSNIQFRVYITYTGGAPQLDGTSSYYSYTRIA
jgi:hypothetical protein